MVENLKSATLVKAGMIKTCFPNAIALDSGSGISIHQRCRLISLIVLHRCDTRLSFVIRVGIGRITAGRPGDSAFPTRGIQLYRHWKVAPEATVVSTAGTESDFARAISSPAVALRSIPPLPMRNKF